MLAGQASSKDCYTRRREREEEEDKIDLRGRQDALFIHSVIHDHYVCQYYDYYSFLFPFFPLGRIAAMTSVPLLIR
jgi:hypothetical protein